MFVVNQFCPNLTLNITTSQEKLVMDDRPQLTGLSCHNRTRILWWMVEIAACEFLL